MHPFQIPTTTQQLQLLPMLPTGAWLAILPAQRLQRKAAGRHAPQVHVANDGAAAAVVDVPPADAGTRLKGCTINYFSGKAARRPAPLVYVANDIADDTAVNIPPAPQPQTSMWDAGTFGFPCSLAPGARLPEPVGVMKMP